MARSHNASSMQLFGSMQNVHTKSSLSKGADMRIGLLSIMTLLIILTLSVLAVLATSNARALERLSARTAYVAQETYLVENTGQMLTSVLDAKLAVLRAQGVTTTQALASIQNMQDELASSANLAGTTTMVTVTQTGVEATISSEHGRQLAITYTLSDNLDINIKSWKLTTNPNATAAGSSQNLWNGD